MLRLIYNLGLMLAAWLASLAAAFPIPEPTYAGPPYRKSAGSNKPIRRVVIHSTVGPTGRGSARGIAAYFRSSRAGGSAHYVVDAYETLQTGYDSVICWHAPPNPHTLGVEMCDNPGPVPAGGNTKSARRAWRWVDPLHVLLLRRTAKLTAELCLGYGLPLRMLTDADLRRDPNAAGITTHHYTSQAFRESTHWDPGFWPERRFMRLVKRYAKAAMKAQEKRGRK